MDYKVKSYVMLSIIFVLGFLAGMLVRDLITESPLERMRRLRIPGEFINRLENHLNLTEEQKKEIKPILDKYDEHMQAFVQSGRVFLNSSIDSLEAELKPYLTKEQMELLEYEFPETALPNRVFRIQPDEFINRLEFILSLTEKQKKEIKPVLEKFGRHLQANIQPGSFSPFDSLKAKIKPYLTKEQIKKLDEEFLLPVHPPGVGFHLNPGGDVIIRER